MAIPQAGRSKSLLNTADGWPLGFVGDESGDGDNSGDSNLIEGTAVKVRRRSAVKRFRQEWMNEEMFAKWLRPFPNKPERCICVICGVVLVAGHSELEKHAAGRKHCQAMTKKTMKSTPIAQFLEESNEVDTSSSENIVKKTKACYPIGTVLQQLTGDEQEKPKMGRSIIVDTTKKITPIKRKATFQLIGQRLAPELPENPDAKLICLMKSDTEDEDFDEEEEDIEELDELLTPSQKLIQELKAELRHTERNANKEKQNFSECDSISQNEAVIKLREAKLRLNCAEENRRHKLNIYKLMLLEMETRLKLADADAVRAEELHQLRIAHLQLLFQKEQANLVVETTENPPELIETQYNLQ